jgi:adenylate cyclase
MTPPLALSDIARCLQGIIPSGIVTSDAAGIPNVTFISQLFPVDRQHVALSRQFFNKTSRNLQQTRRATAEVIDPLTLEAYRLDLTFVRSETSGPLFDEMARRIDAIAAHTGMTGIFRLVASDVCRVEKIEKVEGFIDAAHATPPLEPMSLEGIRSEVGGLQRISDRVNRAADLESLVEGVLEALDACFGFEQTILLLHEEPDRLVTLASRGYGAGGIGSEVKVGEGVIGAAARDRRPLRMSGLGESLSYGRAVRREIEQEGGRVEAEIPLPGLPDAESALVIPLCVGDRLIGALAAESRDPFAFNDWHEAYLEVLGNQVALGIERLCATAGDAEDEPAVIVREVTPGDTARSRRFAYYAADECIFVDDEYLVRSIPAKILWRLLREWKERGRSEFSNRELRLDASLGLPVVKDNLESRLILLRRRLDEKCPDVRVVPTARGRFSLVVSCRIDVVEK